jgi:hypothetical protein
MVDVYLKKREEYHFHSSCNYRKKKLTIVTLRRNSAIHFDEFLIRHFTLHDEVLKYNIYSRDNKIRRSEWPQRVESAPRGQSAYRAPFVIIYIMFISSVHLSPVSADNVETAARGNSLPFIFSEISTTQLGKLV